MEEGKLPFDEKCQSCPVKDIAQEHFDFILELYSQAQRKVENFKALKYVSAFPAFLALMFFRDGWRSSLSDLRPGILSSLSAVILYLIGELAKRYYLQRVEIYNEWLNTLSHKLSGITEVDGDSG